ncbi:MAG: TIGR03915 family putative DNA repair protein [Clostridium sp.]|nr:TIGR03915 family putative DNA repair protein [Clostridium sp.]
MKNKICFLCEDMPDGVFTAIYDVWAARLLRDTFFIRTDRHHAIQLFTDYEYIQTDMEKALKVMRSLKKQIGAEVCDWVYHASLSYEEDKVDCIYDFLKLAFRYGRRVTKMHGEDTVCRMYERRRNVTNEAHMFLEFVRFRESKEGILIARIHPKNQVLPLLADHFSDRFPGEDFVILDENYQMGLFHPKKMQSYLAPLEQDVLEQLWERGQSDQYETLWRTFFQNIAIEARSNYQCQRNMCAIRYRDYMTEFQGI